jgi:DNA-binding response OmpR family regulator
MTRVLVVADAAWARNDVHAALTSPDFELIDLDDPATAARTAAAGEIDVVVADLQVSSMGGMAVARAVRETANVNGTPAIPVILLLDRTADAFLAGRSGAAGWVIKPFTAQQLRTAVTEALAADHDSEPEPVE